MTSIVLNGFSGTGKTSIALKLMELSPSPYMHMSFDGHLKAFGWKSWNRYPNKDRNWRALVDSYFGCLEACVKEGIPVIVDHVLQHSSWKDRIKTVFTSLSVVYIRLECSLHVNVERCLSRGDGTREDIEEHLSFQASTLHSGIPYDLSLRTDAMDPEVPAQSILDFIAKGKA